MRRNETPKASRGREGWGKGMGCPPPQSTSGLGSVRMPQNAAGGMNFDEFHTIQN